MYLTFAIITVSDTCYRKEKIDTAGPALTEEILQAFPGSSVVNCVVPDEVESIRSNLLNYVNQNINIIFTTGGTGFSPRDVTPEATKQVLEREANGLTNAMFSRSLQVTDFAMLSRAVCGITGKSLIINVPGSKKGATECFGFVKSVLKHAVDLIVNNPTNISNTHDKVQSPSQLKSKVILNAADRPRSSLYPMKSMEDAEKILLNNVHATDDTEEISVSESLNRILSVDIYAREPIPPFDASIKDGYAVISYDDSSVRKVRTVTAAGDSPVSEPLKLGEVIRISTGAPIPLGADAVVQVEDTFLIKKHLNEELEVRIDVLPKIGQDIRRVGSDIKINTLVIKKGSKITAPHIGVLTMLGNTKISVYKQASIGIISTGNELCDAGAKLKPGQIRDSNKLTLINLLTQYNYSSQDCGIARDTPDNVLQVLTSALEKHDVIITTGGVSMGEFDVIKQVLVEDFGADIHFGRINMKPGKPTTFATLHFNGKQKYIFALPGNPVSCGVTCLLFVIPTLRILEHDDNFKFPIIKCTLTDNIRNTDQRPEYVRVVINVDNGVFKAYSTGNQISSRLNSLLGANGLLILPGKTEDTAGKSFDTILFSSLNFC